LTLEALFGFSLINHVIVVKDDIEAMEFLRCESMFKSRKQRNPAVLLLDIKMPRMYGIEVLQAVRNDTALNTLAVVMITSSREEPDLKRSYKLGANAYVIKPVDFREFMEAVKQLRIFRAVLNEVPP
jgi:CheY-like chemotaxis protein